MIPDFEIEGQKTITPKEWMETIDDLIEAYELDERVVMAALRPKMKGFAVNWYKSHVKGSTTWREMKKLIKEHFKVKVNVFKIISRMTNFTKPVNMTLTAFLAEMETIAQGQVNEYDLTSITMLNSGNRMLMDLANAGIRVSRLELWQKMLNSDNMYAIKKSRQVVGQQGKMGETARQLGNNNKPAPQCYKCDKYGHYTVTCSNKVGNT